MPMPRASQSNAPKAQKSDGGAALVEAINSLRVSNGEEPLQPSDKFFKVLERVVCMGQDEIDSTTETLRDLFEMDSDHDGSYNGSEDSDDSMGDFNLSPRRDPSVPEYTLPKFSDAQTIRYMESARGAAKGALDWTRLDNSSVVNIHFGANFSIDECASYSFCNLGANC
jgi:hypothetical protein